jgi:DNA modification methylase
VVLDPFAGVGPVGLAASRNGRGFVCIERDADYDQIARARIKKAV